MAFLRVCVRILTSLGMQSIRFSQESMYHASFHLHIHTRKYPYFPESSDTFTVNPLSIHIEAMFIKKLKIKIARTCQLHQALRHGTGDLTRRIHDSIDRVAPQGQRALGHALGELSRRLGDALRGLVEEIMEACAKIANESDRVTQEFEGADELVQLVHKLHFVVFSHAGYKFLLCGERALEHQSVELDRCFVDVGDNDSKGLHSREHGII
jgi:hypothetical protein